MNLIKTIPVVFFVCLLTITAHAQKCKFDKDKIDGFTKERTRSTMIKVGKNNFRWWIEMEQKGSRYFMTFHIFQLKDVHDIMTAGTKLMMKLENGQLIEFVLDKDIEPVQNVEQMRVIVTQWSPQIELTEAEVKTLSTSPVELIRTSIADKQVDSPDVKGKQGDKIMNMAACFLRND